MKTLVKKHMIGLFALVLAVATMSFKMVEANWNSGVNEEWYYTENVSDFEHDPTKYVEYAGQPCPGVSDVRCSITAPRDTTGYPLLSAASNITYKN